jgi:hypothetical protein
MLAALRVLHVDPSHTPAGAPRSRECARFMTYQLLAVDDAGLRPAALTRARGRAIHGSVPVPVAVRAGRAGSGVLRA